MMASFSVKLLVYNKFRPQREDLTHPKGIKEMKTPLNWTAATGSAIMPLSRNSRAKGLKTIDEQHKTLSGGL